MSEIFLKLIEIATELMTLFFGPHFLWVAFAKPEDMLPLMLGKKLFGSADLVQLKELSKWRVLPVRAVWLLFSLSSLYTA